MRQVRRQISEQQGQQVERDMESALHSANQQWNSVFEPLNLPPGSSIPGRLWDMLRTRLHHEVRSYLDAMIYRQTEFNSSIVRALNSITRRNNFSASTAELESLRDEVIQLREQVRQLQERLEKHS
jgi:O-antigen chain-terminating methyltransferase